MVSARHRAGFAGLVLLLTFLLGCAPPSPGGDRTPGKPLVPERIVAIGDLHGDLAAAETALQLAGATNRRNRWIGGDLVVVQTGDILDRGDGEREILEFFQNLRDQARSAGGDVLWLNGNHELMNSYLDFRYVTPNGLDAFSDMTTIDPGDSLVAALEPQEQARAAAFRPGGPMAMELAQHPTALVIGPNVFVHGGILPYHVEMGLDSMNAHIQSWLRNEVPQPEWIRGDFSPIWTRAFSAQPDVAMCDTLTSVLEGLGVKRMIVGHTVQRTGITAYCGGRVWCIDVGLAAHYEGRPEVLEIRGDVVQSIRKGG